MTCAQDGPCSWGFFTVLEHPHHGLVGGYLILNAAGRPLEFHCTAPVKANRAQQILFGPTLPAYLYGEQIGQTLLGKGSATPRAVFTNTEKAIAVRDFASMPVALVLIDQTGSAAPASDWHLETTAAAGSLSTLNIGSNRLATREADRAALEKLSGDLTAFDLAEPFERIREAIDEAHKTSRAA